MANVFKKEILSSYKTLIRLSRRMPTKNRRDWMEEKVKEEFRRDPHLKDVNEVQHRLSLAKTQIDNADVMVRHLTRWLGNDQDPDPLDEFGPSSPNSELDSHNYDWELEIDTWRITHPRHCEIHEAGTLQAIDLWNKMVKNRRIRKELLPKPPSYKFVID